MEISLWGYSPDYELLTLVLGFLTAVSTFVSVRKNSRLSFLESKFEGLKDYAKSHTILEYVYIDLILLGPRRSGKTSVAKLWTQAWSDIRVLKPSEDWETCEISLCELRSSEFFDQLFETNREKRTELRVRIHDFPGEDRFRIQALGKIATLGRATLILFFDLDADSNELKQTNSNNAYYSRAFMETIEQFNGLTQKLEKVIMVFNKRDLLPPQWSDKKSREELRRINRDAINRIESLFSGKLETFLISAQDNTHLISLLGAASSPALGVEEQKRLAEEIRAMYEKRAQ